MAKSHVGIGNVISASAMLPGLGAPATGAKRATPGVLGLSKSAQISPAAAREAQRCAVEGVRLVQGGRVADGVALLKRSIQLNPGVAAAHHDLGGGLIAAGRLEEAAEAFGAALRLDAGLASAHQAIAQIFDALGQDAKAMASYRAAVALKPRLSVAQFRLGDLYLARGQRVEAAASFRAAASASAAPLTARIAEARALEALDAFDEALAAMSAIVEAHPESGIAHGTLGRLLSRAGRSAEAAAIMNAPPRCLRT